jgi:transcriptional adapter 3
MSMFKRVRLLQRRYSLSHFGDLAPASGHKQSQKGTGQMGRDVRRSRSRNTTPSLASTGAHDEAGYTAYLELPIGHFRTSEDYIVYYGNEGFEEFYGTAIPSSELLEGLLERLERLVEVVETRRSVCDKGTRMVAQMRKDRLEEIEIERRDEERKLRDIAEEEERGRNKGNKANKIKKRKDRSTREERPLQYGSHGLTLQDGRNIGESSWFYPPPSRDDDSASSSLSPVAVATPVALGMDIDDDSASSSLSPVSVATPSAAGMDIIDEDTASEEEHGRPEAKRARWE